MTIPTSPGKFRLEIEVTADAAGAELLRSIADVIARPATKPAGPPPPVSPAPAVSAPAPNWDLEKVRRDALGGESAVWRPMLRYLADRRDEWVYWAELCAAVDRTPQQMAGALGAAERRCGKPVPYEKRHDGTDYQFKMPAVVAEVIDELGI